MIEIITKEKTLKFYRFKKYIPEIIIGIIVSIFVPILSIVIENIHNEINLYKSLNNISIGTNVKYMEECFGTPKFHYLDEKSGIVENIYFTEREIVRAYFVNDKLEGYFVTKVKNNMFFNVKLPDAYKSLVEEKEVGKFTFYDINYEPRYIKAYATQGYSHYLYCEEYYFASSGRYREFFFGYFDYGYDEKIVYDDNYVDDEVYDTRYDKYSSQYLVNRKESYPNTYGICSGEYYENIFELVSNYYEFDWET